ncbi:MAG: phosphoribosylamine--glycine ligase [Euryarchaeota archaeon]|nr:phosphoribosylamine--glycine ligase [Euryarchaeota archaeon]
MEKLKFLVIGSGGREYIIVRALSETSDVYAYMFHENPGIKKLSKDYVIGKSSSIESMVKYAKRVDPDIVVIGPENPLAAGVVDALEENGFPTVGPKRDAAKIEWDKSYARDLMRKYNIPGSKLSMSFDNPEDAKRFIDDYGKPVVVKPAGLTGGKGVRVVGVTLKDNEEAKKYVDEIFEKNIGGLKRVLIEERTDGEEFTLQAFVDGTHMSFMPLVQDHPHAFEDDQGPETGGMGSYSMPDHKLPFLTDRDLEIAKKCMEGIIKALKKEGVEYKGILYGQFMVDATGPKLIEFNSRFGDPEAINVIPLLHDDLSRVFEQIVDRTLSTVVFRNESSIVKYIVPKGYPIEKTPGWLRVAEDIIKEFNAGIAYASVIEKGSKLEMLGSRALAIYSTHPDIIKAESSVENAIIYGVTGEGFRWRKDIGKLETIRKRIERMAKIRERI